MLAILDDGISVAALAVRNAGASLNAVRAELEAIMDSAGYRGTATREQWTSLGRAAGRPSTLPTSS